METSSAAARRPGFSLLILGLAAIGVVSRLAPLLDQGGRLLWQFPSEDGYLMLTMARNIALGHGMSIAEGTIATNGTQPLATYLYAGCFWLVGGARSQGVALALLLQFLIASAAALLLYRIGRCALAPHPQANRIAALAAATWYATPVNVSHSMNCLETGLYLLLILAATLALLAPLATDARRPALARWAGLGALLGLVFWARNDAVLLCGAVGIAHLLDLLPYAGTSLRNRIAELAAAGSAALAVAAPWLISNLLRFGNIVPISGQAESLHVSFAHNLLRVPTKLFEYLTVVLPIPGELERQSAVVVGATLFVGATAVALFIAAPRWKGVRRSLLAIGGIYTLALCVFYGLFFGAGHFMSRYLFAASPFLVLLWAGVLWRGCERLKRPAAGTAKLALGAALVFLLLGLNIRIYLRGERHQHQQVVEWVEANVPPEAWTGAVQTGTLGFFHDRTINLDGKVNPAALAARRKHRVPVYIVETPIDYLVDWAGIAHWTNKRAIAEHFELVVNDRERNLAVLRRKRPRLPREPATGG